MKFKSFCLFTALIITVTTLQAGGPWPLPKGKSYFKLSEWWVSFDQHFTDDGKLDPNPNTGIYTTSLYAEYGLTDRLTGVVNFPFFSHNAIDDVVSATTGEVITPSESLNGLGDAEVSLRYGISTPGSALPIAISLTLGLPLGEDVAGEQGRLQTGDGEFNQVIMAHIGSGFKLGKKNAYWSAQLGINNRTNGFSDEFRYGLEGGIALMNTKLWVIGRLNGVNSFFNGDVVPDVDNTSIFSNNTEFLSPGLELNYYVTEKLGFSVGAAGAISGKIIAASPGFSAGVFLDLK